MQSIVEYGMEWVGFPSPLHAVYRTFVVSSE